MGKKGYWEKGGNGKGKGRHNGKGKKDMNAWGGGYVRWGNDSKVCIYDLGGMICYLQDIKLDFARC